MTDGPPKKWTDATAAEVLDQMLEVADRLRLTSPADPALADLRPRLLPLGPGPEDFRYQGIWTHPGVLYPPHFLACDDLTAEPDRERHFVFDIDFPRDCPPSAP